MSKKKFTPCSLYNTEKLECWLNTMAAEGLLLEHEGYKNTYAIFKEAEKQKTYHRIWPKNSLNEYRDAKELRESYGWEFVASFSDFDIYRTFDESSLRIDYDKKNRFYIKKSAKKRLLIQIPRILFSVIINALILFILPYIIVSDPSVLIISSIALVVFVFETINTVRNICTIQKSSKQKEKSSSDEDIDWKKRTLMHQIPNNILIVILIILYFFMLWAKFDSPVSEALPADRTALPFATVTDFTNSKTSYTPKTSKLNVYEKWEAPAAKNNYEWSEYAKITDDDGNEITCRLVVDYHETIHPSLAKAVAKLYVISSKLTPNSFEYFGECPSFGFEYEVMYHKEIGDSAYVFQNGCKIIHFSLGYYGDLPEDFNENEFNEKCIEIMAESFRK